ncbi:MAG TPA: methyltransferase domain-containing protein [Caulobacteraceae bacterium]|jgi:2-polyprenyl-3-methyl-5-hydroxy-6-metoxy-1,4-benzoquinol methylase
MVLQDEYADRLLRLQTPLWKRVLDVQAPYRWNLRRLQPGRMLDVGCGIGRNLANVPGSVGVDPNEACVAAARRRGFEAYTPAELTAAEGSFDSLLIAHVLEHLTPEQADQLAAENLKYLKPGGRLILITPQERTFAMDATHIWFVDFKVLGELVTRWGLTQERAYSFPFPRWLGKLIPHNEFVVTARKAA